MSEVSKSLIVTFDALNLVKGIKSIGGPDKQVYYIESDVFAPDRRITPLILQPYILVEDPHKIIASGDKVGELSSAKWYFDEIKSENRITAKEEDASMDTPFAMGVNNSLHIRKNVERATQLFFEAEYLDIRKNKNIHITLTYMLSTTQSSEVKPAPKLKLSKPQSWKYCPLDKITEATIEAEVFADNKGYKSAVEWCKVENNKEIPLTDEPFVLGGQNSNKLVVNPNVMGDTLLRARNLSEDVYNRFYGINTEWDGRMQEVMENRNLLALSKRMEGVFVYQNSPNFLAINNNSKASSYVINVVGMQSVSISLSADSVFDNNRFSLAFYKEFKHNQNPLSIPFNFLKGKPDADKYENIEVPKDATIAVLYYSNAGIYNIPTMIKLEQGGKSTAYTPAPEDLNYRNLVLHSSNYKSAKGWRLLGNSLNMRIEYGCLAYDAMLNNGGWKGIGTEPILSIYKGHKYYSAFECFSDTKLTAENSPILDVTLLDSKGVSGGGLYYSYPFEVVEINKRVFISGFLFGTENANDAYLRIRHALNTNKRFTLKLDNIRLINLTKKFGSGNEPTLELCDEIFANYGYIPAPEDLAPSGIIKGSYQSDIKFTKYFPEINAEILFLTGDSIRPEHKTIKAQAIFTTNKEPINDPSEFFDIEWFIDPIEAGGVPKKIGTGEFMEIAVSELPLKGGRLVPIRLKYNFK